MIKKYPLIFMLCYSLIFFLIVYLPVGNTGANKSVKTINIATLPTSILFNAHDLAPGDWITRELIIQNNGNENFKYQFSSRLKSGSEKLYNQLRIKIEQQDNSILYYGQFQNFTGLAPRTLSNQSKEKLTLTVEFPYELNNDFQGLTTNVEFVLYAEGDTPLPPPDDEDPSGDGDDGTNPPDDNGPPAINEPPSTNETPSNNPTPTKPAEPLNKNTGSLPQTGEENPILIIMSGFILLLAGLSLLLFKKSILPNPFKRG